MNKPFILVFDTNTLISAAILKSSVPAEVFDRAIFYHIIIYSFETLVELTDVLFRSKFDKYISASDRKLFLNKFLIKSFELRNPDSIITDCRDPKDNKFLELAIDGKAQYIITGDPDLLVMHPYHTISIITPAQFLTVLTSEK